MLRVITFLVCAVLIASVVVGIVYTLPGKKHRVSGTITRDGKPLEWKGDKIMLLVLFVPMDRERDKNVYRCEGDPVKGTYVLPSIPTGKYRISIQQVDPIPTHDLLQFRYSLEKSPLVDYEVSSDRVIDIDLPRELPR